MAYKKLLSNVYCRWFTGDDGGLDTDSLLFAYELLHHAGFLRTLFYDRDYTPEPAEILNFWMQDKFLTFILYREDGTPIAMSWMEAIPNMPHQRFGHFTTFKTTEDDSLWIEGGKQLCRFVRDAIGLKQLIGLTPKCYRHAVNRAKQFGYVPMATLSNAAYCLGKKRDLVMSINDLDALGPFEEV